ncbi:MAG TPA: HAMP domain-containing sensor histidine kinase [Gemmatimonadaceae bacterium]
MRLRWPLVLLLVSVGATALAAWEAQRAFRSQRATAERALAEYASFAAWSYQQHLRERLGMLARETLGAVNHGEGLHTSPRIPAASELAHYLPFDERCGCHRTQHGPTPARFFGFTLGADTLGSGVNHHRDPANGWEVDAAPVLPIDPQRDRHTVAEQRWITDTLTRQIRSRFRSPWGFAWVVAEREGRPRVLAYTLMPTTWGDTLVYGAEYTERAVTELLSGVLDGEGLLPAPFTAGRRNRDVLDLTVADARGTRLFATADDGGWTLDATHALAPSFGGLAVHARIRPRLAGDLVIGGLPRSRLPWMLALLALAGALSVVAVAQLRRESQLARMRADFVSSVSHELRTPLAQVRLWVETLRLGRAATDAERAWALDHIDRETRRLAHLVENVLRFSRGGREDATLPAPTDVGAEVAETVAEFAPLAASRRARVDVAVDETPPVRLRPDALRRILLNLLDNAVKYGPPGQTVRVRLTTSGDRVRLTVEDEGSGVAERERELVWLPFQRGTAATLRGAGGSGIGLTLVRELVELHGGRAWVEGARFVVELPALGVGTSALGPRRSALGGADEPSVPPGPARATTDARFAEGRAPSAEPLPDVPTSR